VSTSVFREALRAGGLKELAPLGDPGGDAVGDPVGDLTGNPALTLDSETLWRRSGCGVVPWYLFRKEKYLKNLIMIVILRVIVLLRFKPVHEL
jgi:hypothetical protein